MMSSWEYLFSRFKDDRTSRCVFAISLSSFTVFVLADVFIDSNLILIANRVWAISS